MIAADVLQEGEEVSTDGEGEPPSFNNTCPLEDLLVEHIQYPSILFFVNFCDYLVLLDFTNMCLCDDCLSMVRVQELLK